MSSKNIKSQKIQIVKTLIRCNKFSKCKIVFTVSFVSMDFLLVLLVFVSQLNFLFYEIPSW